MPPEKPIQFELISPHQGLVNYLEEKTGRFNFSLQQKGPAVVKICQGCLLLDDCRPQMAASRVLEEIDRLERTMRTGIHIAVGGEYITDRHQCKLWEGISWEEIIEKTPENQERYRSYDNLTEPGGKERIISIRDVRDLENPFSKDLHQEPSYQQVGL